MYAHDALNNFVYKDALLFCYRLRSATSNTGTKKTAKWTKRRLYDIVTNQIEEIQATTNTTNSFSFMNSKE